MCTGNLQADFTEICRRNNAFYTPPIVLRPKPPVPVIQQESSPVKGGKDKGKQAQPEPEPEETTEDGGWFPVLRFEDFIGDSEMM